MPTADPQSDLVTPTQHHDGLHEATLLATGGNDLLPADFPAVLKLSNYLCFLSWENSQISLSSEYVNGEQMGEGNAYFLL